MSSQAGVLNMQLCAHSMNGQLCVQTFELGPYHGQCVAFRLFHAILYVFPEFCVGSQGDRVWKWPVEDNALAKFPSQIF